MILPIKQKFNSTNSNGTSTTCFWQNFVHLSTAIPSCFLGKRGKCKTYKYAIIPKHIFVVVVVFFLRYIVKYTVTIKLFD